jgi:TPR repeat protein
VPRATPKELPRIAAAGKAPQITNACDLIELAPLILSRSDRAIAGPIRSLSFLPLLGYFCGEYLEGHALVNSEARFDVAIKALNGGYDRTASALLTPLAEKGDAEAQYHLATMYEHGWGTAKDGRNAASISLPVELPPARTPD